MDEPSDVKFFEVVPMQGNYSWNYHRCFPVPRASGSTHNKDRLYEGHSALCSRPHVNVRLFFVPSVPQRQLPHHKCVLRCNFFLAGVGRMATDRNFLAGSLGELEGQIQPPPPVTHSTPIVRLFVASDKLYTEVLHKFQFTHSTRERDIWHLTIWRDVISFGCVLLGTF